MEMALRDDELREEGTSFALFVVILSLLIHGLLAAVILHFDSLFPHETPPPIPVATRLVTESELQRLSQAALPSTAPSRQRPRNVVESEVAPTPLTKPKTAAENLGERTQRVEHETVAPNFGSVTGSTGDGKTKSATKAGTKSEAKRESESLVKRLSRAASLVAVSEPKRAKSRERRDESGGEGGEKARLARGNLDVLNKDIAIGSRTLLNTDEFVYASFFNRIKAEVAPRWEPYVQRAIQDQKRRLSSGVYETSAEFWLNSAGEVVRVEILRASGERYFDEAARESLRSLPPLKNPPEALREKGGLFRVELGFVVNLAPGMLRTDYVPDSRFGL